MLTYVMFGPNTMYTGITHLSTMQNIYLKYRQINCITLMATSIILLLRLNETNYQGVHSKSTRKRKQK